MLEAAPASRSCSGAVWAEREVQMSGEIRIIAHRHAAAHRVWWTPQTGLSIYFTTSTPGPPALVLKFPTTAQLGS